MTAADDYCDFCDLPRSQCIHGRPAPAPTPVTATDTGPDPAPGTATGTTGRRAAPRPRRRATPRPTPDASTAPAAPPRRRWSPPELFTPLILEVLEEAGGELDAEEVFLELEIRAGDRFLPGDHEKTPQGEPRWQAAARRARVALIDQGLMVKSRPGVWELARPGGTRT